jgi:hypothetical protein
MAIKIETHEPSRLAPTDATILVAGLIAATRCDDRFLADLYRRELEERHGIRIQFARKKAESRLI